MTIQFHDYRLHLLQVPHQAGPGNFCALLYQAPLQVHLINNFNNLMLKKCLKITPTVEDESERSAASLRISPAQKERFFATLRMTNISRLKAF
jgi:hypothetical protein